MTAIETALSENGETILDDEIEEHLATIEPMLESAGTDPVEVPSILAAIGSIIKTVDQQYHHVIINLGETLGRMTSSMAHNPDLWGGMLSAEVAALSLLDLTYGALYGYSSTVRDAYAKFRMDNFYSPHMPIAEQAANAGVFAAMIEKFVDSMVDKMNESPASPVMSD